MKRKDGFRLSLYGVLLAGCLSGCGAAALQGGVLPAGTEVPQSSAVTEGLEAATGPVAYTGDSGECTAFSGGGCAAVSYEELFKPYEQFGLTYDSGKNELCFHGKAVRWFEDYYPLPEDGAQAGNDFFNEDGIVDVYAVRDFSSLTRGEDGSFDPSGKLVGVREFTEAEFAARDIEAIKNPRPATAIAGDPPTVEELEEMAKEYAPFGVAYDAGEDQWYWNGEKVRFFRDVMTSNGESLTGGKFKGTIRMLESAKGGTIDIYMIRDYANPDVSGNGTLTGIGKFSQEEFEERTGSGREIHSSSGECTVVLK